ncbi:MAG: DUF3164 family protein [Flavobacteriaceae bacterium]|nr:DUF3164 family protein [Flavobacteriaceae bacterium]
METHQKSNSEFWYDENNVAIPYNRTTRSERLMERHAARILKQAESLNAKLAEFKTLVRDLCREAYDAFMAEKGIDKETKGNFTWYNFNRSIKIEVSINERIEFDDLTIEAAKARFDAFLKDNITSKNQFAKEMIIDAFETQRAGKLDVKRILQLTRYEDKINDDLFSEAVKLINEAIRRPDSKTYFRVWRKDDDGKYQNIDLNFSSI